jgi:hypothetical protein
MMAAAEADNNNGDRNALVIFLFLHRVSNLQESSGTHQQAGGTGELGL